jgi:uncharacterized protein
MSRIVIFGGSGYAGGNIAREAVSRGHEVVSYTRNAPEAPVDGVDYRVGSVADAELVAKAAADADQVVVAVKAEDVDGAPLATYLPTLVDAAVAGGARLSFVGGAGTSLVSPGGRRLVDTPQFHDEWKPEAARPRRCPRRPAPGAARAGLVLRQPRRVVRILRSRRDHRGLPDRW